ncbi:MAG: glycosyl transferase family protein [Betaproteobacteria bacterium]|nr:glycosyl transferase family protein [Betaproteobacteria bacterium]
MIAVGSDAWRAARNILCVRLDNLGDVLMTTPAIRALKAAQPGRRITLLTSRSAAAAAPFLPAIDEVLCFDAPWVKHARPPDVESSDAMRALIRSRGFDAAVIFTVYSQNPLSAALFCYLAEIPLRLAHCRENPYHLLTDWVRETEPAIRVRHEVQRQLDLVATVGARAVDVQMQFEVPLPAEEAIGHMLNAAQVDATVPLVVMHPGASAPSRRYPPERFAKVVQQLNDAFDCHLAVTGGTDERELTRGICASVVASRRPLDFAGRLGLGELGALISRADLLISNNTGPVHIAAAVGTPVVDLYALTNPQHTPWQVPNRVLSRDVACKYCYSSVCPHEHHRCLRGVEPSEVVTAACELLDEATATRAWKMARAPQRLEASA